VAVAEAQPAEVCQSEAQAAQAVQVSSSLNTSPNLITKSSNHQDHGLHPVALLRSSILWLEGVVQEDYPEVEAVLEDSELAQGSQLPQARLIRLPWVLVALA
jgi:hypothetical protein